MGKRGRNRHTFDGAASCDPSRIDGGSEKEPLTNKQQARRESLSRRRSFTDIYDKDKEKTIPDVIVKSRLSRIPSGSTRTGRRNSLNVDSIHNKSNRLVRHSSMKISPSEYSTVTATTLQDTTTGISFSNMKPSDLNRNASSEFYSEKEAQLVRDARPAINRYSGRTMESVVRQPYCKTTVDLLGPKSITVLSQSLVLGGRDDASDLDKLKSYGITHILNCAQQLPLYHPGDFIGMKVPMTDTAETNILEHMDTMINFIRHVECVQGRVLVHCISGVSRSVTVICVYLMQIHHMRLRDAYNYCRSCRPFIGPNDGFKMTLAEVELKLRGRSSVTNYKHWEFYAWNSKKQMMDQDEIDDEIIQCCSVM